MAWILSALVVLIAWAVWLTLNLWLKLELGIWIPIVATSVVAVFVIAMAVVRRIRAQRAARGLEAAIAQQGAQQAMNARPERRAEIQELQRRVQSGIAALKSSKLGHGKKGGASALYSLPWYVIIGPPGAGKTTALKHSGLVFPYAEAGGGAVRGVGGTRNCDWWFTNEAILLDTAGRYTTEQDDRDEWIAFLQMLRRYRSRRPINGILVAISVTELIDANEQQIDATAKKIRARIDEVMTQLHMVVPVYVLFTKCDLIAGFVEFFGDLRKSERAQAWGATFRLDAPKNEPGKLFEAEFDLLVKQLHARALKRLAMERSREAREKIFQFPLELAAIKKNLSDLINTTFMVNAFQGTPIFRGFYFTSGTQEGRPLDRVLGRMGQAMGIRPPAEVAAQPVVESKSYFLHDVFMNVVFPDGDIAARSESEVRRQRLMRVAVAAAAFVLATIVAIPSVVSFFNNRSFLTDTEERARAAAAIRWDDGRPAIEKLALLTPVLERLKEIDGHVTDGVPVGMGWPMYSGDEVYRPTMRLYVWSLQQGFVQPVRQRLEERLKVASGEQYLRDRLELKTYLMLSDIEHLDVPWATGRLVSMWAEILRATTNVGETELKNALRPHVEYYLTLLKEKKVTPLAPNTPLVESVRRTLQSVPVRKRYYDQFVNALIDEKYDEAGDNTRANKKYPPLSLNEMFTDRPDVLKVLGSARLTKEKRPQEVEGPYTEKGHLQVVKNVAQGEALLLREEWVVPLTEEEKGERVAKNLADVVSDYEQRYIGQWSDFLADIYVKEPSNPKEAVELFSTLARPEWPYLRILRALQDHTQWPRGQDELEKEIEKRAEGKLSTLAQQKSGLRITVDIKSIGGKVSSVPSVFAKTVEFGVPVASRNAPVVDTPLAKYVSRLEGLKGEIQKMEDASGVVDQRILTERLIDVAKETEAQLQPLDDKAKAILRPLLLNPLRIGGRPIPGLPAAVRFSLPQPGRMPGR